MKEENHRMTLIDSPWRDSDLNLSPLLNSNSNSDNSNSLNHNHHHHHHHHQQQQQNNNNNSRHIISIDTKNLSISTISNHNDDTNFDESLPIIDTKDITLSSNHSIQSIPINSKDLQLISRELSLISSNTSNGQSAMNANFLNDNKNLINDNKNIECVVCGDKSSGKHYGQFTCEGSCFFLYVT